MIDPVIERRIAAVLEVTASDYVALERRREASMKRALQRFEGFDAWISPTTAIYPPPVESLADSQKAFDLALGMTRNTQPANYLDLCAVNIPLPMDGHALPAGLQVMCPPGDEERLLGIAIGIETLLGRPQSPVVEKFLVSDH